MRWRSQSAAELGLRSKGPFDVLGLVPAAPRVAIVGSRAAHRSCRNRVKDLVAAAGSCGWSVVSGGARGIDRDVHEAALELRVPQLAVLPCGRDELYPPDHVELFERLARAPEATLLCAYPPGKKFGRGMFVGRNDLMVALADAVVVVEANLRSGSAQTGRLALRRGRPLAVLLGSPGTAALVGHGAIILGSCTDDDVRPRTTAWLDSVASATKLCPSAEPWPLHLMWLQRVFETSSGALDVDDVADGAEVDVEDIAMAMIEAEMLGLIVEAAPGRYVRAR